MDADFEYQDSCIMNQATESRHWVDIALLLVLERLRFVSEASAADGGSTMCGRFRQAKSAAHRSDVMWGDINSLHFLVEKATHRVASMWGKIQISLMNDILL